MKLVVGLGNPGAKYDGTRHNIGFAVLDQVAGLQGSAWKKSGYQADTAKMTLGGRPVWLAKPTTFMNLSGEAVQALFAAYRLEPNQVLVVCDDMDLSWETLRLRRGGRSGGHHGLDSIIEKVGSNFCRLRVGIGRPQPPLTGEAFVLQKFPVEERASAQSVVERAADAVVCWITEDLEAAMNRFNSTRGTTGLNRGTERHVPTRGL